MYDSNLNCFTCTCKYKEFSNKTKRSLKKKKHASPLIAFFSPKGAPLFPTFGIPFSPSLVPDLRFGSQISDLGGGTGKGRIFNFERLPTPPKSVIRLSNRRFDMGSESSIWKGKSDGDKERDEGISSLGIKDFDRFWNQCFDKGQLKAFVFWFLKNYGESQTVRLLEKLKDTGFKYATKAGVSISIDDLKIPKSKSLLIGEAETQTFNAMIEYRRGNITGVERFQKLIDTWHRTSELLKQEVIQHFEATDILNPVYMMAFSGARGNVSQVRQLVGMRGLMADPQGQIIDFPIRSNFREGLTLTEYIISSYGARKGIVDTALRTANAGYLTRRLVDVAQHVIVAQFDCGTERGIFVMSLKEGNKTLYSLQNRLVGRVLAQDLCFKENIIAYRNQEISVKLASQISLMFQRVFIRSPLTCETKKLVCQLCYGWSLAQGSLVSIGEAVGIIAAQSIGEPGTQLTMRTFHTGGVFSGDVTDQIIAPFDGFIEYSEHIPGSLIRTPEGKLAFLTKSEGSFLLKPGEPRFLSSKEAKESNLESGKFTENRKAYKIPAYTVLFVKNKEKFLEKQVVAQISTFSKQKKQRDDEERSIKAEMEGEVYHGHMEVLEQMNDYQETKLESWEWGYVWVLAGKIYQFPISSYLFPKIGDLISQHSPISRIHWFISNSCSLGIQNFTNLQLRTGSNVSKISDLKNKSNLPFKKMNHLALKNILGKSKIWELKGGTSCLPKSKIWDIEDLTWGQANRKFVNPNLLPSQRGENGLNLRFDMKKILDDQGRIPYQGSQFEKQFFFRNQRSIFSKFQENCISKQMDVKSPTFFTAHSLQKSANLSLSKFKLSTKFSLNRQYWTKTMNLDRVRSFQKSDANTHSPLTRLSSEKQTKQTFLSDSAQKTTFFSLKNVSSLNLSSWKSQKNAKSRNLKATNSQKKSFLTKVTSNKFGLPRFQTSEKSFGIKLNLLLKKSLLNFALQKIQYKKMGYFLFFKNASLFSSPADSSPLYSNQNTFGPFAKNASYPFLPLSRLFSSQRERTGLKDSFFMPVPLNYQPPSHDFQNIPASTSNWAPGNHFVMLCFPWKYQIAAAGFFCFFLKNAVNKPSQLQNNLIKSQYGFKNKSVSNKVLSELKSDQPRPVILFKNKHEGLEWRNTSRINLSKNANYSRRIWYLPEPSYHLKSLDFIKTFSFKPSVSKALQEKRRPNLKEFSSGVKIASKLFKSSLHSKTNFSHSHKRLNNFFQKSESRPFQSTLIKVNRQGLCDSIQKEGFLQILKRPFEKSVQIEEQAFFIKNHLNKRYSFLLQSKILAYLKNKQKTRADSLTKVRNFTSLTFSKFRSRMHLEKAFCNKIRKKERHFNFHFGMNKSQTKNTFLSSIVLASKFLVDSRDLTCRNSPKIVLNKGNLVNTLQKSEYKIQIKKGWAYIPVNEYKAPSLHKKWVQAGETIVDDLVFDKHITYVETLTCNSLFNIETQFSNLNSSLFPIQTSDKPSSSYNFSTQRWDLHAGLIDDPGFDKMEWRFDMAKSNSQFRIPKLNWIKSSKNRYTLHSSLQNQSLIPFSSFPYSFRHKFSYPVPNSPFGKNLRFGKAYCSSPTGHVDLTTQSSFPSQIKNFGTKGAAKPSIWQPNRRFGRGRSNLRFDNRIADSEESQIPEYLLSGRTETRCHSKGVHALSLETAPRVMILIRKVTEYYLPKIHQFKTQIYQCQNFENSRFHLTSKDYQSLILNKQQKTEKFLDKFPNVDLKVQCVLDKPKKNQSFASQSKIGFQNFRLNLKRSQAKDLESQSLVANRFLEKAHSESPTFLNGANIQSFNKKKEKLVYYSGKPMNLFPCEIRFFSSSHLSYSFKIPLFRLSSLGNLDLYQGQKLFQNPKKTVYKERVSLWSYLLFKNHRVKQPRPESSLIVGQNSFNQRALNLKLLKSLPSLLSLPIFSFGIAQKINNLLNPRIAASYYSRLNQDNSFIEARSGFFWKSLVYNLGDSASNSFHSKLDLSNLKVRSIVSPFKDEVGSQLSATSYQTFSPFFKRYKKSKNVAKFDQNSTVLGNSMHFRLPAIFPASPVYPFIKNQLFLNPKNQILAGSPFASTQFFSPYNGEIVTPSGKAFTRSFSSFSQIEDSSHSSKGGSGALGQGREMEKLSLSQNKSSTPKNQLILTSRDLISFSFSAKNFEEIYYLENLKMNQFQKKESTDSDILIRFQQKTFKVEGLRLGFHGQNRRSGSPMCLGQFMFYGDSLEKKTAIHQAGLLIHINQSKITLRKGQPIFVSPKAILHQYHGDFVRKNESVVTLAYQRVKTGDIVQGIPKIEQIFEARTTKRGRLFRDSLPHLLENLFLRYKYKLSQEKAVRQSYSKIRQIIVDGVQRVYRSQGVSIADKHIEVIVKEMTSKVRIVNRGVTAFFPGELVDLDFVEQLNKKFIKKLKYEPVVLGISKASLSADSFLASASFQHTIRVLSRAAIYKKQDFLRGLKENVIVGNLIPAGTGFLTFLDDRIKSRTIHR